MNKYIYTIFLSFLCLTNVFGQGVDENPNKELLKNEFFHEVTGNVPTNWIVSGATSEVFNSGPLFNSGSGYALRLITSSTPGYVEQIVDITDEEVAVGKDVEGLIHYAVDETKNEKGALRLMMQWLDSSNNVITSQEDKKFIDNESLLFSKFKAWGTLLFRATKPANAKKFRFAIQVEANSNVRFDDFSLKRQDSKTGFIAILPQELRPFHANVGESQSQKVAVQIRNFVNDGTVTMPLNQPFSVDKETFDNANGTKDLTFTFNPTKPIKIPRGFYSAPVASIGLNGSATTKIQLKGMAIDPNNPPTVTLEPAVFPDVKLSVGDTKVQDVLVKVKNAIDNVNIKIEPAGKGFAINTTSLYYFSKPKGDKKEGVNDTYIKVTFRATKPGKVEGKLIFTSDLMTPVEYKISATVDAFSENIEEKFTKEKEVKDVRYPAWADGEYHFMDTGIWSWPKKTAEYQEDTQSVFLSQNGTTLTYEGEFIPGQIYNQSFPNGIKQVTIYSAGNGSKCKLGLDVSYDGGGSWTRFETKEAPGDAITAFKVNSHKNTLFRIVLVNDEGVGPFDGYAVIEKVKVLVNSKEERENITNERLLADYKDKPTNARLFTEFNDIPHHLNLSVDGWSNYSINTNRGFVSFDEHESDLNSPLVESCAKVSLYKSTKFDEQQPMKAILISPMLSYKDAASKQLGFRLKKTIVSEGDKFSIYILKLKNGLVEKEEDMIEIPFEKLLPEEKMSEGFWYDYLLDLDKYNIPDLDNFAVMFMFSSNNSPENTTTSYFIDDFSWGRTDNPVLTVDKKELKFYNMSNQESEPLKLVAKTENATAPIVLKLFGHETSFFLYNNENTKIKAMPKDGGELLVTVKTQASKDINSILYMATRNGAPVYVTLFATKNDKEGGKDDKGDNPNNNSGVDKDGYDLGDDIINGKTPVDEVDKFDSYAYKSANGIIVVSEGLKSVTIYDINGNTIKQVNQVTDRLSIDNVNIQGTLILKLVYNNGKVKTIKVL